MLDPIRSPRLYLIVLLMSHRSPWVIRVDRPGLYGADEISLLKLAALLRQPFSQAPLEGSIMLLVLVVYCVILNNVVSV